ncbi:MAG: mechanosensitive ion channel [Ardenticatenaceae bacterium]|nr:mechanosensitive ion channel [Ardenticatenaceae bacterium]MCB9446435.1 mechanosensitive ion channel [Ardenticatenaceae bacterium]
MIEIIRDSLQRYLNLHPNMQARLLNSLLIILALILLRLILLRIVNRRFREDTRALYSWSKGTEYFVVILGIFLVGRLWLEGVQSLATYLGLLSAGIAIALQDLIVNLAAWAFIIWRRPFTVGDRIEINGHAGDVIDVRLFAFSLLEIGARIDAEQSTGRVVHLPNGVVFREAVANFSHGLPYIWNEIPVMVTFESNWELAKAIVSRVVKEHAPEVEEEAKAYGRKAGKRFVISYGNVAPTVYTKVEGSGVLLTMRYLVNPRQRRNSEQQMWEAILRAFAQHDDIDFAYETVREFNHWREGKPALARQRQRLEQTGSFKIEAQDD